MLTPYFATIWQTLGQFGAVITIGGLLVLAFVYLYSTAKKGRQDIIRQDNADLRASNQEMRTEKAGLEATIKETREQNHQLRDIATQTPAVTKLIQMNTKQQEQINKQHTEVIAGLTKLTSELSNLVTEFAVLSKAINKSNEIKATNGK